MEQQQQGAEWAQNLPASVLGSDGSLTLTIKPGLVSGWMVWSGANREPDGYFSSQPEAWEYCTRLAVEAGRPRNEMPFRPLQPQQLMPPPQMQYQQPAPPPRATIYPAHTQSPPVPPEPMPSFMDEKPPTEPALKDKIASVMRAGRNGTVNGAYLFMAGVAVWQLLRPFGA